MCTLLKVANRRPANFISPFFVHEEQITSVGSIGDNSAALAFFSCTVRIFSALSSFFTRFPRFGTFAVRAALRPRWSSSTMQCNASTMRCRRGPRELWIICPPLAAGYDLSAAQAAVVPAHGKCLVKTGLKMALPTGCYGRIAPRSGLAIKKIHRYWGPRH